MFFITSFKVPYKLHLFRTIITDRFWKGRTHKTFIQPFDTSIKYDLSGRINSLEKKINLAHYTNIQSVPRSKHTPSQL